MHQLNLAGLDFIFTREYLKAGVLVSLLSVWVLVALFYYLNRYTKRRYFTIWTASWLFYALWLTLSFGSRSPEEPPLVLMLQQWCLGVAALFLLWGSLVFLGEQAPQRLMAWFIVFLLVWSYVGAFYLNDPMEMEAPTSIFIALASLRTSWAFVRHRQKQPYIGATLLCLAFLLWGGFMAVYPYLKHSPDLISLALFLSTGIQLLLAVSMIILVLEEARHTREVIEGRMNSTETERLALETRVASTEERYRHLFNQASEAIVITNAEDFRILELNHAAETLLGITRAEASRHCLTAFCQLNSEGAPAPQTSTELFETICRQHPLNLVSKNGGITPLNVNGARVEFDGQPACEFFLVKLTERARLEEQLRQAEKLSALGQMISGVAHELNNPLAVVKGYLELILAHHDLKPQTRADLEKVARESNRAAKLVKNFLTLARQQPMQRDRVALNELILRMVELRRFDLMVAKTELVLDLAPNVPAVMASADQVQQMIVNLMNNALQAMVELQRPGKLRIETRAQDNCVRILVEDSGPGVPPELAKKIFEPFFTTKEVGTGTGLGLSIAHNLMTEHKGRIYYQTSRFGGAGFVLEFPAAAGSAQPASDTSIMHAKQDAPAEPRAGRILVLDDEKSIAEMLGEMLSLLGYTPTLCHNAAQAIELLERRDFDLIVSDFRMPGINGRQFFEIVCGKKPAMRSRIIFLTGDVVNEDTQKFLRSTGNPHLAKPFNLENVEKIVADVIHGDLEETIAAAAA